MRKTRDGGDTKLRVLSAAQELFALKGFSGTSLADISGRCGISDGLILHHFHSKKNLYRQVLENLAGQYVQNLVQVKEAAPDPQEMVRHTLAATFDFWRQDVAYQRISLWAYLEGQTEWVEKEAQLTAGIFQEVQRLQQQGVMDNRFSPLVILTLVIGPIHFWLRYRDHFKVTLKLPETSEELDRLFLEQLIQLIAEISRRPVNLSEKE